MFLSVAICTYNGENYLEEQLDSILNQNFPLNELVICDDGSKDRTVEILKAYQRVHPNLIFPVFNTSSLGTIKNFEKAISLTKGELIFLSDQDDIWEKNKVEKTVNFFSQNKYCKMLFSNGALIDENGKDLQSTLWDKWGFTNEKQELWKDNVNAFQDLIRNNNKITGATICLHRDLKDNVIPIKVPIGYWHDAWLGIHASAINSLCFINECLIKYRIHGGQQVGLSTNVGKAVIERSNKYSVDIKEFFKGLRKMYPEQKKFINRAGGGKTLRSKIKSLIMQFGKK